MSENEETPFSKKLYIHIENGGIEVKVNESAEFSDYTLSFSTQYYGYPFCESSLSALNADQLIEISQFLQKAATDIKLRK